MRNKLQWGATSKLLQSTASGVRARAIDPNPAAPQGGTSERQPVIRPALAHSSPGPAAASAAGAHSTISSGEVVMRSLSLSNTKGGMPWSLV